MSLHTSLSAYPAPLPQTGWAKPTPQPASAPRCPAPHSPILTGESSPVFRLRSQVERIAPYFRTVVLRGEPGSGKHLVARELHRLTASPERPFVQCPAVEFADAWQRRASSGEFDSLLWSLAGGTLYLESIDLLSPVQQKNLAQLLALRERSRLIPERRASNPGAPAARTPAEFRLIAGAGQDLRALVSTGQFRSDLYSRLSGVEILIPSVSERLADLPLLAAWALTQVAQRLRQPATTLSAPAAAALAEKPWARNLHSLEAGLQKAAAAAADSGPIEPHHLALADDLPGTAPPDPAAKPQLPVSERLQDVVHQHVMAVLTRCGGNKLRAAETLGISRSTLYRMLEAGFSQTESSRAAS